MKVEQSQVMQTYPLTRMDKTAGNAENRQHFPLANQKNSNAVVSTTSTTSNIRPVTYSKGRIVDVYA